MDIEVLVNGDDDVDCEDSNEIGDSSEESDDVDNNSGSNENDDDGDDSGNSSKNDDGDGDGDDSSKNDDVDGLERSNIDDDDDDGNPSDDDDDDNGSGTDIGTTSTTVDNYNDGSGDNGDNNDDADNENSTSEIAEEPLKNIDANLTLIGINDLLIVRNRDKKVVFILDILFNIVILIEGDTKTVIVINLSLRSGFLVINKGLLNLEWVGLSSVNPTVVVSSIKSITLLKSGIKRFGLDSVNEEIINVLFNFAKILEPLVKEDLELDKELSVELIVSVFERILIYSTSTLKGLPKIIGVKEIHLPTGIPALANNIEGLAKLLELVAPLDELPDIGLNAEIIFGAENGLVTITHILERVIKHSDIVPIDGLRALTPASVTEISSLLGGQIVVESSGITRRILKYIVFAKHW
ncbi:hypothetical protein ABEB36_001737 [Hypothenemus hampei]|uniref:Uncharacterized protein n=1 Tax=Hypothenemus hampei TaxID=57062 RepID=A0ABD1FFJ9_HYPHA